MAWLNDAFGGKFPISWSLGIICTILVGSMVASLIFRPKRPTADEGSSQ
jgi:tellurite resistance protein TerC